MQVAAFLYCSSAVFAGSTISGIAGIQEMLNCCAEHSFTADIELIDLRKINHAHERMKRNEVKYRFEVELSKQTLKELKTVQNVPVCSTKDERTATF